MCITRTSVLPRCSLLYCSHTDFFIENTTYLIIPTTIFKESPTFFTTPLISSSLPPTPLQKRACSSWRVSSWKAASRWMVPDWCWRIVGGQRAACCGSGCHSIAFSTWAPACAWASTSSTRHSLLACLSVTWPSPWCGGAAIGTSCMGPPSGR